MKGGIRKGQISSHRVHKETKKMQPVTRGAEVLVHVSGKCYQIQDNKCENKGHGSATLNR